MKRRDLLALIAAATGCAVIGYAEFAPGMHDAAQAAGFEPEDVAFLDAVAETIIPRTDTPGASDVKVGQFITDYAQACYLPSDLATLQAGIPALDAELRKACGKRLMDATPAERLPVLTRIDREARAHALTMKPDDKPHYFTLMKQLTLLGFFTSEPGATKVARYREIPGHYTGDVPYKGEGFWSWA